MPRLLAPCWKNPFSEQLSGVHVRPDKYISSGTLQIGFKVAWGGRYKLKAISQPTVEALWDSFNSFPLKQAIVALVVTDIF